MPRDHAAAGDLTRLLARKGRLRQSFPRVGVFTLLTDCRIYRYIGVLVAYAAGEVMKQIPEGDFTQTVNSNKVYRWLMHESAHSDEVWTSRVVYPWILFRFTDSTKYGHVATIFVPATDVASTVVSVSSQTSVCSCNAIVPETVYDAAENVIGGE